jgi:hypothetical protein
MGTDVAENLAEIRRQIAAAAQAAGRKPEAIRLVGVCKKQPIERIEAAIAAGVTDLGQNYVQEMKNQVAALRAPVNWHFVGALQRNKVKDLVNLLPEAPLIHTLDRLDLAKTLQATQKPVRCLIQVLPEGDFPTKERRSGCPAEDVIEMLRAVKDLTGITIAGLMILPPLELDPTETRKHFRFLKNLGQSLQSEMERLACERLRITEYSMGMTADLREAVAEGATLVRVGTGLFGERQT